MVHIDSKAPSVVLWKIIPKAIYTSVIHRGCTRLQRGRKLDAVYICTCLFQKCIIELHGNFLNQIRAIQVGHPLANRAHSQNISTIFFGSKQDKRGEGAGGMARG